VQKYSVIKHLAMGAFLGQWKKSSMAMFVAYFDESGSPDDTCALVVAGLVASTEQWIHFERNWNDVLAEFGVAALHMKHYAHSIGEFKGWKGDKKRDRFMEKLLSIMKVRVQHTVATAVLMDDYRKLNEKYQLTECFKPYTIVATTCIAKVKKWAAQSKVDETLVDYVFEMGAKDRGDMIDFARVQKMPNISFFPKEKAVPLQAADLLAYEHLNANRTLLQGKIKRLADLRYPFRTLNELPNNNGKDWGVFGEDNLEQFCINASIPKRKRGVR